MTDHVEQLKDEIARLKRELAREVSQRRTQAAAFLNLSNHYQSAMDELTGLRLKLATAESMWAAAERLLEEYHEAERLEDAYADGRCPSPCVLDFGHIELHQDASGNRWDMAQDETDAEFLYDYDLPDAYADDADYEAYINRDYS